MKWIDVYVVGVVGCLWCLFIGIVDVSFMRVLCVCS